MAVCRCGLQEGVQPGPHGAAPTQHSPGKRRGSLGVLEPARVLGQGWAEDPRSRVFPEHSWSIAVIFSSQEILCPFSAPYLGYQAPTGLFGGCNSFLGHSNTPLSKKPNKAWLFLFLTLTPGQQGAGGRAAVASWEPSAAPGLATCTASGRGSCFLFGRVLCFLLLLFFNSLCSFLPKFVIHSFPKYFSLAFL